MALVSSEAGTGWEDSDPCSSSLSGAASGCAPADLACCTIIPAALAKVGKLIAGPGTAGGRLRSTADDRSPPPISSSSFSLEDTDPCSSSLLRTCLSLAVASASSPSCSSSCFAASEAGTGWEDSDLCSSSLTGAASGRSPPPISSSSFSLEDTDPCSSSLLRTCLSLAVASASSPSCSSSCFAASEAGTGWEDSDPCSSSLTGAASGCAPADLACCTIIRAALAKVGRLFEGRLWISAEEPTRRCIETCSSLSTAASLSSRSLCMVNLCCSRSRFISLFTFFISAISRFISVSFLRTAARDAVDSCKAAESSVVRSV